MELTLTQERRQAHALIDLLPPAKLGAVRNRLEVMVDDVDDEPTAEDSAAIQASREYFRQGGEGLSLEQVAAERGWTNGNDAGDLAGCLGSIAGNGLQLELAKSRPTVAMGRICTRAVDRSVAPVQRDSL
jgi:hypothetical protein